MSIRFFTTLSVRGFLFTVLLLVSPVCAADKKPQAADLVNDGQVIDLSTDRYNGVFKELRLTHSFSREKLDRIFKGVTIKRRVLVLMDRQWEAKPYYQYSPMFVTRSMVKQGRKMLRKHSVLFDRVEKEFGVEREIVTAIWGIESKFGQHKGAFDMFRTLNTLFDAYPRRRNFYRKQLIHFLVLCRENGIDPLDVPGSYGGAFGQTQFIPSSFREYAVDFDKDGSRDVWRSIPDILASIANYLHRFHWTFGAPVYWELGSELKDEKLSAAFRKGRKGLVPWKEVKKLQGVDLKPAPDNRDLTIVGLELADGGMRFVAGYPNFQAITKWNNSNRYAMAVTELAEKF